MAAEVNGSSRSVCYNYTRDIMDELIQWIRNETTGIHAVTDAPGDEAAEDAGDAVMYIIAVLTFYSIGIVIMMVKYIRREQREMEEAKKYTMYIDKARKRIYESTTMRAGSAANRLAMQALNTAHAIPQTTTGETKVTFV